MDSKHLFLACAMGASLMLTAAPAHAIFGDDEARKAILDLRERMTAMQNAQLQLQGQIDQLRESNAQLTGRVEQLANNLSVQQRSMRSFYTDLDTRVRSVEGAEVTIDGEQAQVSGQERRRFDLALKLFSEERYKDCSDLLKLLLTDYPDSAYAPSALYWRGNALYASDALKESVAMQNELIKRFPKHARVPEAMLSKAAAQLGLGQKSNAVTTLRGVIKMYAGTDAAKVAQERLRAIK